MTEEKHIPSADQAELLPHAEPPIGVEHADQVTPGTLVATEDHPAETNTITILPRYKSHKIVQAGVISNIETTKTGGFMLSIEFRDGKATTILRYMVSHEWVAKFKPVCGDWLVRYSDGYLSCSPAKAFEDGYTLVEDMPETPPALPVSVAEMIDLCIDGIQSRPKPTMTDIAAVDHLTKAKALLAGQPS